MFLNIYEFTEKDLKSNHHGFITQGQKAWLQNMAVGVVRSSHSMVRVGLGFTLFGTCLILVLFLQNDETRKTLFSTINTPAGQIAIIGSLLAIVALLTLGIFLNRRQAERLMNAQLLSVEGAVSFEEVTSPTNTITSYHLLVGKEKILFGDDPAGLFMEGKEYRIHFIRAGAYELVLSYDELNK